MIRKLSVASTLILASACQSMNSPQPALLVESDEASIEALKTALAGYLETASVRLGAGDPTVTSTVSVLPPPLNPNEDRSTAMPILFELWVDKGACYAVRDGHSDKIGLPGVSCVPAASN